MDLPFALHYKTKNMTHLPTANDKLREATFFFELMERYIHEDEFRYLVSAFLEALYSLRAQNRLRSQDPRFRHWYQSVAKILLNKY